MNAKFATLLAAGGALLLSVGSANAYTFSFEFFDAGAGNGRESVYRNDPGVKVVDFNELSAPLLAPGDVPSITSNGVTYTPVSGGAAVLNGAISGQAAPPPGDTSNYLSVSFPQASGETVVTFAPGVTYNYFGMFWGSGDDYNDLDFYLNGVAVAEINGIDISPGAGDQGPNGATYLNLYLASYDEIRIRTTQFAFESDNHTFGNDIPEPATLALLGAGLLGLALRGRRRRG